MAPQHDAFASLGDLSSWPHDGPQHCLISGCLCVIHSKLERTLLFPDNSRSISLIKLMESSVWEAATWISLALKWWHIGSMRVKHVQLLLDKLHRRLWKHVWKKQVAPQVKCCDARGMSKSVLLCVWRFCNLPKKSTIFSFLPRNKWNSEWAGVH